MPAVLSHAGGVRDDAGARKAEPPGRRTTVTDMARTLLFTRLRRLFAQRLPHQAERAERRVSRRDFVQSVVMGLSAVAAADTGCTSGDAAADRSGPRVAVIGAGMAGLMCTHLLEQAGVRV